jgi:hypothetical protein
MKLKTTIPAVLLALGIVIPAHAQNVVYLTGSTAFRSTVYNALNTPGVVFDAGSTITLAARGGGSVSGANYMLFLGPINGTETYVNCAWSGSEAGIASVSNVTIDNDGEPLAGSPQTWLKADGSVAAGWLSANPAAAEKETSTRQGDLAMADTSQGVSLTPRVPNTQTDLKDYGTVGIVTFTWVKNINSNPSEEWSALKNLTLPQVQVLLSQGSVPVAFFTGIASQTNTYVYLVGRNKGSGTRANALADHGYGTTRTVQQFSIGGGVSTPTTNVLQLAYEGNNGYESGGGVAAALAIDGSCQQTDPFHTGDTGWIAVGYLGTSDALSHGLTTNQWLTADGIMASNGPITEGQYYFWGNEHLYGKRNISGFQDTVGQKLLAGVKTVIGTSGSDPAGNSPGIAVDAMHAEKVSDTAFPTRK